VKIIADLHLHTVASGHAFSTIEEYLNAASAQKLKVIAITDHGPAMPGGAHLYHFSNLKMLPCRSRGILMLRGIEANIINDKGDLDLPDGELKSLEIVLAAFHIRCGYQVGDKEKNTRVLKRAMAHPHVNVLAHPGNVHFPVNIKEIVGYARECGVLIEINNATFTGWPRQGSYNNCLEFAREVKRQNWYVCLGSDSHFTDTVGKLSAAVELVKEAGIKPDHVINSSVELVEEWFIKKKRGIST
jgi:putative hydrolase